MTLPDKWTKLELEAFHNSDAVSVAIKLHQLIDYLAERDTLKDPGFHLVQKTNLDIPLFKARDIPKVQMCGDTSYALIFRTKEAAEQAREALLKLKQ